MYHYKLFNFWPPPPNNNNKHFANDVFNYFDASYEKYWCLAVLYKWLICALYILLTILLHVSRLSPLYDWNIADTASKLLNHSFIKIKSFDPPLVTIFIILITFTSGEFQCWCCYYDENVDIATSNQGGRGLASFVRTMNYGWLCKINTLFMIHIA